MVLTITGKNIQVVVIGFDILQKTGMAYLLRLEKMSIA